MSCCQLIGRFRETKRFFRDLEGEEPLPTCTIYLAPRLPLLVSRATCRIVPRVRGMDPEVTEKAKGVFTKLVLQNVPFVEVLADDFARWRLFFRHVKESSNDPTSALGELSATSFLGKHDIQMSNWGKNVKERSELFKCEFEKFIALGEVREALAADLGLDPPPTMSTSEVFSGVVNDNGITHNVEPPSVSNSPSKTQAQHPAVPPVPDATPPKRTTDVNTVHRPKTPGVAVAVHENNENNQNNPGSSGVVSVELDVSRTHVTSTFHRQRVLSYLDGFQNLLLDLQSKVDEIATSNLLNVGGAVERANARLEQALERVAAMTIEESAEGGQAL